MFRVYFGSAALQIAPAWKSTPEALAQGKSLMKVMKYQHQRQQMIEPRNDGAAE